MVDDLYIAYLAFLSFMQILLGSSRLLCHSRSSDFSSEELKTLFRSKRMNIIIDANTENWREILPQNSRSLLATHEMQLGPYIRSASRDENSARHDGCHS